MLSVNEQVSQEIHQGLKNIGLDALSHENKNSLKGQLQNIAKKENCIRVIIGKSLLPYSNGREEWQECGGYRKVDLTLGTSYKLP